MLAYDPSLNGTVLFGGNYPSSNTALNDTWTFHAGVWSQLTGLTVAPPARWAASFVFDPQLGGVVLFGGRDAYTAFNDTWLFHNNTWSLLASPASPSARLGAAMAYDSCDRYMLLYGGGVGNVPAGSGSAWVAFSDTWRLSSTGWVNLTVTLSNDPGPRFGAHLAYWVPAKEMVFTGGSNAIGGVLSNVINDTWTFANGTWSKFAVLHNAPTDNVRGEMAYYAPLHRIVLFGGQNNNSLENNDTWAFDGHSWVNWTARVGIAPPPRGPSGFAYDASDSCLLLFGGTSGAGSIVLGSTWEFT
jgi:hypothetical protein